MQSRTEDHFEKLYLFKIYEIELGPSRMMEGFYKLTFYFKRGFKTLFFSPSFEKVQEFSMLVNIETDPSLSEAERFLKLLDEEISRIKADIEITLRKYHLN